MVPVSEIGGRQEKEANLYALDVRGMGQCTPSSCNMPPGSNFFGGIPSLIAAVLSDDISRIRLKDVRDSWESMIIPTCPEPELSPMSCMILGIMQNLDLLNLRSAIADKILS